jgi:hypothetical protein
MKKFKFLSAMAALLVAGAMVSCTSSDDPVIKPIISGLTTGEITYKVTVTSNVETKFTFNGETKTGKTAEFEVNASNYKAALTAKAEPVDPAYSLGEKNAKVAFSTEKQTALVEFNFVKPSTEKKSQAEMTAGGTVANDAENQKASGINVTISAPEGTVITGNTTDPFSVTAYQLPASQETAEIKKNQAVSADIYTFDCKPDGAVFDKELTLKANLGKEAAGMQVAVNGVPYIVDNDGFVEFKAKHFSTYTLTILGTVVTYTPGKKQISSSTIELKTGENEFKYNMYQGMETSETGAPLSLLVSILGEPQVEVVEGTGSFNSTAAGTATLTIEQEYLDVTVQSNTETCSARVWGEAVATVTPADGRSHSGGAAE